MITIGAAPSPEMDTGFNVSDYVDLSKVRDPQLRSDTQRTLEYFASKPEGRELLEQAAKQNGKKIVVSDYAVDSVTRERMGSAYGNGMLVINKQEIATNSYYTSPQQDATHTAPLTLSQVLWHELEHAREPTKTRDQVQAAVTEAYHGQEAAILTEHNGKKPGSVIYGADRAPLSVHGVPIAQFREEFIQGATEWKASQIEKRMADYSRTTPATQEVMMGLGLGNSAALEEGVHVRLFEDPAIARTNAAMKQYYPNDPSRFGHDGLEGQKPHDINVGTPTLEQLRQQTEIQQPAPTSPSPAQGGEKSVPAADEPTAAIAPKAANPFAGIDLSGLDLSWAKGANVAQNANVAIQEALAAAPKATPADARPQSQSTGIA